MTTLSAIPPFPALSDRAAGTYNSKAYAFGAHMGGPFVGEINAVRNEVEAFNQSTTNSAASASSASAAALANANYKGEWSALTGALAVPASFSHLGELYMLLDSVADITGHIPGVSINIGQVKYTQSLELIQTVVATAAATVEWTNFETLAADYAQLRILGDGIYASAGSNTLKAKIRQNGAWQTTTTRGYGANGTAQTDLTKSTGLGATAGTALSVVIEVQALGLTTVVPMAFRTHPYKSGELCNGEIYHSVDPTTPVQGIQIYANTGTLTGTFRLYGVRK